MNNLQRKKYSIWGSLFSLCGVTHIFWQALNLMALLSFTVKYNSWISHIAQTREEGELVGLLVVEVITKTFNNPFWDLDLSGSFSFYDRFHVFLSMKNVFKIIVDY